MSRVALQTLARSGAISLVNAYRATSGANIGQVLRARPAQLKTPTVFVESVAENTDSFTNRESQRTVRVGLRAVWGVYDAGATVDARDTFVDGLYAYIADHGDHAFGPNTVCSWISVFDTEVWTPDWLDFETQAVQPYYATLITLEGFAST